MLQSDLLRFNATTGISCKPSTPVTSFPQLHYGSNDGGNIHLIIYGGVMHRTNENCPLPLLSSFPSVTPQAYCTSSSAQFMIIQLHTEINTNYRKHFQLIMK